HDVFREKRREARRLLHSRQSPHLKGNVLSIECVRNTGRRGGLLRPGNRRSRQKHESTEDDQDRFVSHFPSLLSINLTVKLIALRSWVTFAFFASLRLCVKTRIKNYRHWCSRKDAKTQRDQTPKRIHDCNLAVVCRL